MESAVTVPFDEVKSLVERARKLFPVLDEIIDNHGIYNDDEFVEQGHLTVGAARQLWKLLTSIDCDRLGMAVKSAAAGSRGAPVIRPTRKELEAVIDLLSNALDTMRDEADAQLVEVLDDPAWGKMTVGDLRRASQLLWLLHGMAEAGDVFKWLSEHNWWGREPELLVGWRGDAQDPLMRGSEVRQ